MGDKELHGGENAVGLNHENTVGVMETTHLRGNQTRDCKFTTEHLVTWAKMVDEAYDGVVRVSFAPAKPLIAQKVTTDDTDVRLGIGVAPRVSPEKYEELQE